MASLYQSRCGTASHGPPDKCNALNSVVFRPPPASFAGSDSLFFNDIATKKISLLIKSLLIIIGS